MMFQLTAGARIEDYELTENIGVGSSGEIWKATNGHHIVAIKFMRENLLASNLSAKHRERWDREIHALKILKHPNIPALYAYNEIEGRPYIIMEFIDSPSLDKIMMRGEMLNYPIKKRMNVVKEVASALRLAHKNGIIHRDLKPGNINGIDHPYLMDFSIALLQEQQMMTNANIGTSIYMDPDFSAPDELSDIYSFAVVAYEILFGRHPIFAYDDPVIKKGMYARIAAAERLKEGTWHKPSKLTPAELPQDMVSADLVQLDAIFARALGIRTSRYTDPAVLALEIETALTSALPSTAMNMPSSKASADNFTVLEAGTPPAAKSPMNNKILVGVGMVALVAIVVVLLVMVLGSGAPS